MVWYNAHFFRKVHSNQSTYISISVATEFLFQDFFYFGGPWIFYSPNNPDIIWNLTGKDEIRQKWKKILNNLLRKTWAEESGAPLNENRNIGNG